MLVVISPAKRLDWDGAAPPRSQPRFLSEANRLAGHARQLGLAQLKALMGLSDDLARLNRDRFRAFAADPDPRATRAAVQAFAGDTYQGLAPASLDDGDLAWAQDRLCILSGLYGLLRPGDAIQPYRLEMGSRLKTRRGATLYAFWGDTIARAMRAQAAELGAETVLNCASQEYFGAVDLRALGLRVITPQFLELKDGTPRMVSFFAKRARGAMARHVITRRASGPEAVLDFRWEGYAHAPDLSQPDRPAFLRDWRP